MYIALAKHTNEFAAGQTMEELLKNAKVHIAYVDSHESLLDNCEIHELGKPLIVKAFVNFEVTPQ